MFKYPPNPPYTVMVKTLGQKIMNSISNTFRPLLLASTIALILAGCGESSDSSAGANYGGEQTVKPTPPSSDFNETNLLANLADNVISPTYQAFTTLSAQQQQAIGSYCQAPSADTLKSAQDSWKEAMAKWQQIEVMQIGPLTDNSSTLRNNIYSWPVTSSCGVDQDVMYFDQGTINEKPYDIAGRTATRRGLDALEYLLFNTNTEHSCTSTKDILASWSQHSDNARLALRCNFAATVASDLTNNANTLVDKWSGTNGYASTLKNAGQVNNKFANAHDGINVISDALFYIDKMVKDEKLATPLGFFSNDCGGVGSVCPQNVESPYSDNAINNLINNLIGFKTLFNGEGSDTNNTLGFDDFLVEVNDSATATKILNDTDAAIADLQGYNTTLAQSLSQDSQTAEQTHRKIKNVSDQLKTDFINSLALKLPQTSAGDND